MSLITDLISENVGALVNANCDAIEEELKSAENGKLTISLPVKLTLAGSRVYLTAGLTYSRKFTDEVEASIELDDPKQPRLIPDEKTEPTVTIRHGDQSVSAPLSEFKEAVNVARKQKGAKK
jgi:hypothetical protein